MRLSSSLPSWAVLLAAAVAVGSGASCDFKDTPPPGTGGTKSPSNTVAFVDQGTLELAPSQTHTIGLTANPGATVTLLLTESAADASLDKGSVVADANGKASVTLKAPSNPTTFQLKANSGENASAVLDVAVSANGFATIRVVPKYTGSRKVTEWTASVVTGGTCDAIIGAYPMDPSGALTVSTPPTGKPVITSVPVGPPIAVGIRSGASMWGCTETTLSDPDVETGVPVVVYDRPLNLGETSLNLTLDFAPDTADYKPLLKHAADDFVDAACPDGDAASSFLDALEEGLPSADLASFVAYRQSESLDSQIGDQFHQGAGSPRDVLGNWSTLAVSQALSPMNQPRQITGLLTGDPDAPGSATLAIAQLGPVDGLLAGVAQTTTLTWSPEVGDTLVIGGSFQYSPSRFVGLLMQTQGIAKQPNTTSGAEALAQAIDCTSLGAMIAGFQGCDQSDDCGVALCQAAALTLWNRGMAASDGEGEIGLAISGSVDVDGNAVPTNLSGTWVGNMASADFDASMAGAVEASDSSIAQ